MRIAYIPSGTAVPPAHAFADPNRKRMFQPGIYCIPTGRLSIITFLEELFLFDGDVLAGATGRDGEDRGAGGVRFVGADVQTE